MPYVQSERSNSYSLHRSARSRGLQAKGERELVPGLGKVSCGLSETLLSSGWDVLVSVCYQVSSPSKWPKSSPFIVEGRTRTVHVLLCGVVPTGAACSNPVVCSCGGVVIGVVRPWSTGAVWPSHPILCVVGAPGQPQSGCGDGLCARPRLDWHRGRIIVGGLGGHEPQDSRDLGVQCRGLEWAADLMRWLGGDDNPDQVVHVALFSRRGSRGIV